MGKSQDGSIIGEGRLDVHGSAGLPLVKSFSNHPQDKNYVPQVKKLGVYDLGVKLFADCVLKDRKV